MGRSPVKRRPCRRPLCKVTSDCFPFERLPSPALGKSFFLEDSGDWRMRAFVEEKAWKELQSGPFTGFQGGRAWTRLGPRVGQGAGVVGVRLGSASPLRPAWASALRRARRDLEGGESFTEQRPSASASDSSDSLFCSFSSC